MKTKEKRGIVEIDMETKNINETETKNKKEHQKKKKFYEISICSNGIDKIEPLNEGEKGNATIWGATWRALIILGVFIIATICQAYFYNVSDGTEENIPGILGLFGMDWSVWWSRAIIVLFYLFGILSGCIMILRIMMSSKKISTPFIVIAVLTIPTLIAILPGNLIGENLLYFTYYKEGIFKKLVTDIGFLKMLPGIIFSILTVTIIIVALTIYRSKRNQSKKKKLSPKLNRFIPYKRSIFIILCVILLLGFPNFIMRIYLFTIMAVYLFTFIPNDIIAIRYAINTNRPANCLWPIVIGLFIEIIAMIVLIIALLYNL